MAKRNEPTASDMIGGLFLFGIYLLIHYWKIVCIVLGCILVLVLIISFCVNLSEENKRNNDYLNNYNRYDTNTSIQNVINQSKPVNNTISQNSSSNRTVNKNSTRSSSADNNYTKPKELNYDSNAKIDLKNCTYDEILTANGFTKAKAKSFIKKRSEGKVWYDMDSFARDFDLQPHERIMLQDRLIFPQRIIKKPGSGRKVDW